MVTSAETWQYPSQETHSQVKSMPLSNICRAVWGVGAMLAAGNTSGHKIPTLQVCGYEGAPQDDDENDSVRDSNEDRG